MRVCVSFRIVSIVRGGGESAVIISCKTISKAHYVHSICRVHASMIMMRTCQSVSMCSSRRTNGDHFFCGLAAAVVQTVCQWESMTFE